MLSRSCIVQAGVLLACALSVGMILSIGTAQDPPKAEPPAEPRAQSEQKAKTRAIQDFMRQKLAASNEILEGLCVEDMELVIKGAKTLGEMSSAERWYVTNDIMYKQSSNEFHQITKDLIKAAEEKNADRVMLKWMDATVSCLDCHRFVRGMRIVDAPSRTETSQP